MSTRRRHKQKKHPRTDAGAFLAQFGSGGTVLPPGPFAESYRIAGYTDGLVGASPECDVLRPHWDSGLTWGSAADPQPGDWRWGAGVAGGVDWEGTFHRDLARYSASGPLFWCSYLKPGTVAGMQGGFWFNFGNGWSHLHNDDPAQILAGASQKLFWDAAAGRWKLVVEATMFVTHAVVDVWTGTKTGGNDPAGAYTRLSGLDPLPQLAIEPQ